MGQDRLRSLVLLNIDCDLMQQINEDEIINNFACTPLLRRLLVNHFLLAELGTKHNFNNLLYRYRLLTFLGDGRGPKLEMESGKVSYRFHRDLSAT